MIRKLLSLFGLQIRYQSEFGTHTHRYDSIDMQMQRPIHREMTVAPPWAKMRISRSA